MTAGRHFSTLPYYIVAQMKEVMKTVGWNIKKKQVIEYLEKGTLITELKKNLVLPVTSRNAVIPSALFATRSKRVLRTKRPTLKRRKTHSFQDPGPSTSTYDSPSQEVIKIDSVEAEETDEERHELDSSSQNQHVNFGEVFNASQQMQEECELIEVQPNTTNVQNPVTERELLTDDSRILYQKLDIIIGEMRQMNTVMKTLNQAQCSRGDNDAAQPLHTAVSLSSPSEARCTTCMKFTETSPQCSMTLKRPCLSSPSKNLESFKRKKNLSSQDPGPEVVSKDRNNENNQHM